MMTCNSQILSTYIDDELADDQREAVEAHVRTCPDCQAEVRALRETSRMISGYPFQELNADELATLHEAVETGSDQPVMRLGLMLSALAASVLIISCTWLMEAQPAVDRPLAAKPAAQWENLAMNLNADPSLYLSDREDTKHFADATIVDWMIEGLRRN